MYFQELMNKVLKDLPFAIAYLDDIIIYSKTAEEHLDHLQQVSHKLHDTELSMKMSKCHFLHQGNSIIRPCPWQYWHKTLPSKTAAIKLMKPPQRMLNN